MQTHNASIYHGVSCGRIVHAELKSTPPRAIRVGRQVKNVAVSPAGTIERRQA
jgi:hypothetical protein